MLQQSVCVCAGLTRGCGPCLALLTCLAVPDYTYDFEGNRVKFTDDMYNERVRKMQDKTSTAYNPWSALFQGNKRTWAEYSIFVMIIKAFFTFAIVFMSAARLRQAMLTLVINVVWLCVLSIARPYLDLKATYADIAAKACQIFTLAMSLATNLGTSPKCQPKARACVRCNQRVD